MNNIYQYKAFASEVKDVDLQKRTVSGYFSAFNIVDAMGDVVLPGAFTKTISEQGPRSRQPRIKHLLNHDVAQPLGKLIDLNEDQYGLFYVSEVGSHSLGADFLKMVDSGLVTEHSIGYQIVKQSKQSDKEYHLHELKLYEGSSLTGWGVNQYTPLIAQLKSDPDKLAQRIKRLEKFCKDSTATDETIEMLLLEIKQLTQLVSDLNTTTPAAVEALEPAPEAKQDTPADDTLIRLSLLDFQHTISKTLKNI